MGEVFSIKKNSMDTSKKRHDTHSNDGGNGGGESMLESRVAKLESDVSYIKSNVAELKLSVLALSNTASSLDKSMAVVIEKLTSIKDSLDKKPSTDAVEKKISDAKLAVLLGVPALLTIGTAIYKVAQHYFQF